MNNVTPISVEVKQRCADLPADIAETLKDVPSYMDEIYSKVLRQEEECLITALNQRGLTPSTQTVVKTYENDPNKKELFHEGQHIGTLVTSYEGDKVKSLFTHAP
jgi:hypothetical protein